MEIKEDTSVWDQLMELKAMTENTGAVHELQVYQLKMWAALAWKPTTEIKVQTQGKPTVTFCADLNEQPTLNLLNGLDRSIKDLLGDYFTFKVEDKGVAIFNNPGKKKRKQKVADIIQRLIKEDAQS